MFSKPSKIVCIVARSLDFAVCGAETVFWLGFKGEAFRGK
jgi:hypothetical protein